MSCPPTGADALGAWFRDSADSGSLVRYLETFDHTVAVMQTRRRSPGSPASSWRTWSPTASSTPRCATRPSSTSRPGCPWTRSSTAVQAGFEEGMAAAGGRIVVRHLLTAMRHQARSREIAELAVAWRDRGVAGFDIAGAEAGYPPTRHLDAFEYLQRENAHFTIHAGEAFGLPVDLGGDPVVRRPSASATACGSSTTSPSGDDGSVELGRLAAYVRDMRIPLEMCPHSNVQTGAADSIAEHPIGLLTRLRFRVTVNTDNRLMSGTSMNRGDERAGRGFRLRRRATWSGSR